MTATGEGATCAATDTKGSWSARSHRDCRARCAACERCSFVSYSARYRDCSWFSACPTVRDLGSGHVTVRVRRLEGSL